MPAPPLVPGALTPCGCPVNGQPTSFTCFAAAVGVPAFRWLSAPWEVRPRDPGEELSYSTPVTPAAGE